MDNPFPPPTPELAESDCVQLDCKCQFGLLGWDWRMQVLSLFEVAVGLTRRNGAVICQALDSIGKLIELLQQHPCTIEALGLLG